MSCLGMDRGREGGKKGRNAEGKTVLQQQLFLLHLLRMVDLTWFSYSSYSYYGNNSLKAQASFSPRGERGERADEVKVVVYVVEGCVGKGETSWSSNRSPSAWRRS